MKNYIKSILNNFELIRFAIVGIIATMIHYICYYLLYYFVNINIAYTIGYILSFYVNFILSAKFTFKSTTSLNHGIGFAISHLINYGMQIFMLNIMVYYSVNEEIAPIPVYIICVPLNFILVRYVFRH